MYDIIHLQFGCSETQWRMTKQILYDNWCDNICIAESTFHLPIRVLTCLAHTSGSTQMSPALLAPSWQSGMISSALSSSSDTVGAGTRAFCGLSWSWIGHLHAHSICQLAGGNLRHHTEKKKRKSKKCGHGKSRPLLTMEFMIEERKINPLWNSRSRNKLTMDFMI